jgi:hypothetical protein
MLRLRTGYYIGPKQIQTFRKLLKRLTGPMSSRIIQVALNRAVHSTARRKTAWFLLVQELREEFPGLSIGKRARRTLVRRLRRMLATSQQLATQPTLQSSRQVKVEKLTQKESSEPAFPRHIPYNPT